MGIIETHKHNPLLFGVTSTVVTDPEKARRVDKKLGLFSKKFFKVFLSEYEEREMLIYHLVNIFLDDSERLEHDYRDPSVLRLKQILKQIGREVHRMHAFVRFQRTADNIWFSAIEPDFDVIPLIGVHFEKRYADQKWVIYDTKRSYGLSYDLIKMETIELDLAKMKFPERLSAALLHEEEPDYQELWRNYFDSVNIEARRNLKLHIRHVPKRYWKSMSEKWTF